MFDAADVVIVGKPNSTVDTDEKRELSGVQTIGQSSEISVRLVMKGPKDLKKITLHHYREPGPPLALFGDNLLRFDPKKYERYLLFLKLESDGRYAPVTGQTYALRGSVLKLEGTAD
jgi:hypothetical protein